MYHLNQKKRWGGVRFLGACLLVASGMPSSAWAECLETPNSEFTLLVDASSSCAALSANMTGCVTDSTGVCTIVNPGSGPDIVVGVTPFNAVGSVPNPLNGEVSWTVISGPPLLAGKEVDIAISLGANAGGTCSWVYTPGKGGDSGLAFEKNNGSYQKVNGLFFCSDFAAPPPSLPRFLLNKTVMLAGGECGTDDVENLDLKVDMEVQYCFVVENIGAGDASGVSLSDPAVPEFPYFIGNLAAGESTIMPIIKSDPILIENQGATVNTATVTGNSVDSPSTLIDSASDTATVNAQLALELCPPDYQGAVDAITTGQGEDGFKYAALLDPLNPERISVCVPSDVDSNTSCVNECILKEVCKTNPLAAECVPPYGSKCEESGNWSVGTSASDCQVPVTSESPYCWEAIQDRNQDCEYKAVEPLKSTDINIQQFHENPFCYLSCADISELKSCNYICF